MAQLRRRIALIGSACSDEVIELLRAAGAAVTCYHTVEDLVAVDGDSQPAVVVIASAGDQSLQAVAALSAGRPDRKVVVLCGRARLEEVRALVFAGVGGIVLREDVDRTLTPTLQAVVCGQVCVPRRHARDVDRPILSIREKQVVGLVAMGLMNSEIGGRLFVAESTVKSHLSSAFAKLGVRSRHEAVELLVNPASGLGLGILSLDADPVQTAPAAGGLGR